MKILVIASAFAPGKGSELGVGFNIVKWLAEHHEVTVITRPLWRQDVIADIGSDNGYENINIIYEDMGRFGWFFPPNRREPFAHLYWCMSIRKLVKEIVDAQCFDLVHYLTLSVIYVPSLVFRPLRLPVVWGPVGGGEHIPSGLLKLAPPRLYYRERLRYLVIRAVSGFYRLATWSKLLDPSAVIARTTESQSVLGRNVCVLSETGITPAENLGLPPDRSALGMRVSICVIGRLVPGKNVSHSLRVFAELKKHYPESVMSIAGDGSERLDLEAQSKELGVHESVAFLGNIERCAVDALLADSDLCLHLSFREGGSWTVFESLQSGTPVCCFAYNGLRGVVTSDNGIPLAEDEVCPEVICRRIIEYFAQPKTRREIATSLAPFSWARKVEKIEAVYGRVLEG